MADGLDFGLFVFLDMSGSNKAWEETYGKEVSNNIKSFNIVIAHGKAMSTVGTAFMCSAAGMPAGLLLKTLGIQNTIIVTALLNIAIGAVSFYLNKGFKLAAKPDPEKNRRASIGKKPLQERLVLPLDCSTTD